MFNKLIFEKKNEYKSGPAHNLIGILACSGDGGRRNRRTR